MTFIKFKFVCKDRDRHGNVRFYFRRPGKPKVRLRGLPGSEEFVAAYKEALSESGPCQTKAEGSFEWLCQRYFQSPYFEFLEKGTQRRKRSILNEVCDITGAGGKKLGAAPYRDMKKIHVRKLRDMKAATPIGANNRVKEISALFAWAVKYDLATMNPAEKFEKLRSPTNGLYTWTEQDVERFEDYWPVGSRPRLAMAIMLYLGVIPARTMFDPPLTPALSRPASARGCGQSELQARQGELAGRGSRPQRLRRRPLAPCGRGTG